MSSPAYTPKPGGIAERALSQKQPDYLNSLNEAQREAVETLDGPVLMLAGAGTGKTRALTTRLAHLLTTGRARPNQVLAVTFTNKAAKEMKARIGGLIGEVVEGMTWLGTFHSIGYKILRRHAELVGLKSDFSVLDTDDQLRLLKQLIKAHNIDEKRWPARQLAGHIDNWKNRGLRPEHVPSADAHVFADGMGLELYDEYQQRLKVLNAADFGDLLLECLTLFQNHPDVLQDYQNRFHYMLVDEYQDTNVAQYLWLRLLAGKHKNICCVGDDDQSIYGWRGAEVDNILRFEKDFPGAKVIRLEQNYRSTPHILGAASHLISHNEGRLGKTLQTDRTDGEKVIVRGVWSDREEAYFIGDDIEQAHNKGHALNEIAILVRASSQMRTFEDRFIELDLPYRVIGGPRFYERMEIRDAVAYLQIIANPDHDIKFERIINTPKRGLAAATLQTLHAEARHSGCSLTKAALRIVESDELRPAAKNSLKNLLEDFDRWRRQAETLPHTELAEIILDESGYTHMWMQDKSIKAQSRLENLKELVRSMGEFTNLNEFLDHVTLVMDTDQSEGDDKINLMTLHAAKGLEFDTVFLAGWEDGSFPNQRAMEDTGRLGLEEERRLAYVGMTRARENLTISFAQNRLTHGLVQTTYPSRFLDELPEEHIKINDVSMQGNMGRSSDMHGAQISPSHMKSYGTPPSAHGQAKQQAPAFSRGERVFHEKFGYGKILEAEGDKLTIDFEKASVKKVMAGFVKST